MTRIRVNLNRKKVMSKKKGKPVRDARGNATPVGQLMRSAGKWGGAALGSYLGNPVLGGVAGNTLGALASKWLGFGDYAVEQNSIVSDASTTIPSMHDSSQSIVVRHKEFLGTVVSSTGFTVQYELPLNPGMPSTFPWLTDVASRFQEYAFKGVVYHYIPTSGSAVAGTSPSLGSVMFQTTYRASDIAPIDKVEMMNEYCASESVPNESFIHPIECDPRENPFNIHYVRNTTPPAGEPLMSYDLGKTFIATQGQLAAGNNIGDVWVTYEVELKKPLIRSAVVSKGIYLETDTGGAHDTIFNGYVASLGDSLNITTADSYISFPPGWGKEAYIAIDFDGATLSVFGASAPALTNATLTYSKPTSTALFDNTVVSGEAKASMHCRILITDPTQVAQVNFAGFTATGTLGQTSLTVIKIQ